ncbi:MAG: class I adenylate-forming enzyme family protein [Acidimicrobiales bacterium]
MRALVHGYLQRTAADTPGAAALVVGDTTVTFGDLDRDSDRLGGALQQAGLGRGDRVAIMAGNSAELVVALWATLKAGGVFVVVNPTTKADKVAYILNDCGVRYVVAQDRLARVVLAAVSDAPTVSAVVWAGGVPDGSLRPAAAIAETNGRLDEIGHVDYAAALAADAPLGDPGLIDADLAGLIYTSGSTGRPKGVMLTHHNIAHNAWSISTYLGLRSDDVVACLLPLSFDYGLFQVFMGARVGCSVVLEPGFAYPRDVVARLEATRVTVLPGVPTIFAMVLQLAPFDGSFDLSAVRLLTNTAAALPPSHIHRLAEAFPQARIFSMYGLTECTRVSYLDPDRLFDKIASVGKAMPNTEVYVVDSHSGKRVAPGVIGELVVRGASLMRGYWGQPEATEACLRDGETEGEKVLYTGDQFWADDEGFLHFVGRHDDVFKSKGEKISPKEIEHVIYELDAVAEVAVIGVPDEIDGHAVEAVVAPRPGATITEAEVRRHCRARLENYMVPRRVEVRDALPKTESGKIRRASLVGELG